MPIAPRFERVCRWPRTLARSCRQTLFNRDSFIKRRSFRRRRRFRSFAALGSFLSIAIALSFRHISYAAAIHSRKTSAALDFPFSPWRSLNPKTKGGGLSVSACGNGTALPANPDRRIGFAGSRKGRSFLWGFASRTGASVLRPFLR